MDSVKVALRIRPLVSSEIEIGCRSCIERITNQPQVCIGKANQLFSYNYVFDELEGQSKVYDVAVKSLISNLFKGYNVTILAYGQTGSGKTFTMGTNYSGQGELGVIPRAIYDIFEEINSSSDKEFKVTTSFIELYNESLYDLLTQRPREQSVVDMRDHGSGICIPGLTEIEVSSPAETLSQLREGSTGRVVGSTAMNAQSSRSHAIFTINIKITSKENVNTIMTSKFHLVDLAGSERSKKTGATGDRFKEGVNINKGLLVLGKVISQLGEPNHGYINYRDSKLTRLLQDSLGGNSVTLMIACISPADYNQDETLSTLRYADNARKIKNKPIVNQDPKLAEIMRLKKENEELRLRMIGELPATECPPEHKILQEQLTDAKKKLNQLSKALSEALIQNTNMFEKVIYVENAEKSLKEKFDELVSLSETLPVDNPLYEEWKKKVSEVQEEQKKVEKGIYCFNDNQQDEEKDDGDDAENQDSVMTQLCQDHIMSQAKRNKELLTLSKDLMWKEELISKLKENSGQLPGVSKESIDELKKQLADVQHEKEELLRQIRCASSSQNNSAKVAETRRKRLQELETKVSTLSKKVADQERVIKMKEKSDEKIASLKAEIVCMKQLKVRLIQQMKAENERFKQFKAQKDREVYQLRNQNMKKQNQLKKMEQMHIMQQNVLRRKLEAAAAANKRIMAALEKQKSVRNKRMNGSVSERIQERLTEEVELFESECQAQKSLENLLQDRAALTKEKATVKEHLGENNISAEDKVKFERELKRIEQDLELRSAEISDLQQKLLDIHQDDHKRNGWDMLQSMADAKIALTHLFNLCMEKVKDNMNKSLLLSEIKDQQLERDTQLTEYQMKISNLELHHKRALEKMEKECEDKVYVFMKLARENAQNSNNGEMSETLRMNLCELEKIEELRKQIENLQEENKRLSNSQETTISKAADPFGKFLEERMNGTFVLNEPMKDSDKENPELDDNELMKSPNEVDDPDDPEEDPVWRNTPIHRRIVALKKMRLGKRGSSNDEKCDCKGACDKTCLCVRSSLPCNENCCCDMKLCSEGTKRRRSAMLDIYDGPVQKLITKKSYFD